MGVLVPAIFFGISVGSLAAAPFYGYRRIALPRLARAGARLGAYLIAAVPALLSFGIAVAYVVGWIFGTPAVSVQWVIGSSVLSLLTSKWIVGPAIRMTGGASGRRTSRDVELEEQIAAAERHFQRWDLERYFATLAATSGTWAPESIEIHDAIRGIQNAHRRHAPPAELYECHRELVRAASWHWRPPSGVRRAAGAAVIVAFLGVTVPTIGSSAIALRACIGADFLSGVVTGAATAAGMPITDVMPITDAIVLDPEPGTALAFDESVDLAVAASSRHDPDTREQLLAAGFIRGHLRGWSAADGRTVHADAFEFVDHEGALEYQRTVTRHACTYANESFEASKGGIGLQVRYSTGDPIVEQVSWVVDNRRYLVSVSHLEPPANHDRVLAIYARAIGSE